MPIIAISREMGSLGKDVARGLGEALSLPVRRLDGSADEIYGIAASCTNKGGAIIRGCAPAGELERRPHHAVGRLAHRRDARLRRGRLPHPSGRGTAAALRLRRLT